MNRPASPDAAVSAPPDLHRLLWATLLFLALGALGIWVIQARVGEQSVIWDARMLQGSVVLRLAGLLLVTLVWRTLTIHLGVFIGIFATHRELTRGPGGTSA